MKKEYIMLTIVIVLAIGFIIIDRAYVNKFNKRFKELEKKRIITSNKLTTAKIIHEKLDHVRDLVFKNMDFEGQKDTIPHESHYFNFMTTCVNDLKLKLISVRPSRPITKNRITTYSYDIEIEGDFFKFGELCSKLENSRRIVSTESFKVNLINQEEKTTGGAQNKMIRVKLKTNTYRVKKANTKVLIN